MLYAVASSGIGVFFLVTLGAVTTAHYYQGRTLEPYSFLNHFISELGNKDYSNQAYYFNDAMKLAGPLILAFMLGVSNLLTHRLRYALKLLGILTSILCTLLGFFSSDQFDIHIRVALCLFSAMLLSAMVFSAAVLCEGSQSFFPRWVGRLGIGPIICIIVFLAIEATHRQDFKNGHLHHLLYNRPTIWVLPLSEWTVFFSLIVWMLAICSYLLFRAYTGAESSRVSPSTD
jgi:hypothetical protein